MLIFPVIIFIKLVVTAGKVCYSPRFYAM